MQNLALMKRIALLWLKHDTIGNNQLCVFPNNSCLFENAWNDWWSTRITEFRYNIKKFRHSLIC